jgi:hypothetical protein
MQEADVPASMPSTGFIWDYVTYAREQTDAPMAYHLQTAIAIFAAACPSRDVFLPWFGDVLYPIWWGLLVGPSGGRKSHALKIGLNIMTEAAPRLVGTATGTAEGILKELKKRPQQGILISEFGSFLSQTLRDYAEPIRALFTDLYDCPTTYDKQLSKNRITIHDPRVTLCCAVNPDMLARYTNETDWGNGFMSRFVMVYAEKEREYLKLEKRPLADWYDGLVDGLKYRYATPAGPCMGFSREATELWTDWIARTKPRVMSTHAEGAVVRYGTHAARLALIYGLSTRRAHGEAPWWISAECVAAATRCVEHHIADVITITSSLLPTPYARLQSDILKAIGDEALTRGEIMSRIVAKQHPMQIHGALQGLYEEGRICTNDPQLTESQEEGGVIVYSRTPLTAQDTEGNVVLLDRDQGPKKKGKGRREPQES